MKIILHIAFSALVATAGSAGADEDVRKRFNESNAPDVVVFRLFVNGLFSDSLELLEHRSGWIYIAPGATSGTNFDDVYNYFVSRYLPIQEEIDEIEDQMLCDGTKPRYSDSHLFKIFDAFVDVRNAVYGKHLALARLDFADKSLFDIDAALAGFPGSFSIVVTYTEADHGGSVQSVYDAAVKYCNEPKKRTFQSFHSSDGY